MERQSSSQIIKAIELISSDNDLIGVGIIQKNYFVYANQGLAELLECSIEDILNEENYDFFRIIHPKDLDFVREKLILSLNQENKSTIFLDCRILLNLGRIKYIKLRSKTIEFQDKLSLLIIMQDYTEIVKCKDSTEKIGRGEINFDLDLDKLLDENPLLGISIFQDNRIKYVNSYLSEITGYTFYELMNMTVYDIMDIIPSEYRMLLKLNYQGVERGTQNTLDNTYPLYRKNGMKIWVHSYGRRFLFLGKPAVFTLTKFISRYKKTVDKNGNTISLEEPSVDVAIKQELEQNLKQLNIKLQEINKLKTDLLYRISHELKTPLIPVKGYTDLLLRTYKEKLDDNIITYLNEIMNGSERLEKLINTLLESSNLKSNKSKLNLKEGDLTILIEHTLELLDNLIKKRDHSIILNLNDELLTKFDKQKIQKVISNLLLNAINYTPKRGQITICSELKNREIIVSIKDNGIGITEQEKAILFRQFGKIERYGKGWDIGTEGPGFGLYNSKKLIELHGGRMWAESEGKNKGTTFCFTIPLL
ncbi:MAG: ATP-binding protein [Candidatus Hermodarchaeota archaeon]